MRPIPLFAATICIAFAQGGCDNPPPCNSKSAEPVHFILTFDDGPFPADIADKEAATPEELLSPLRTILDTLSRRRVQAVFYTAGPGPDAAAQLTDKFGDGIVAIHQSGHVLGYHAFAHFTYIWANPLLPPGISEPIMDADLDRLVGLIDTSLAPRSMSQGEMFSPIFRQPYGGVAMCSFEGEKIASRRGWAYHGYHIDGGDWLTNADADPAIRDRLGLQDEASSVAYVKSCLRAGAAKNQGCGAVDVLFHVNSFTARNLDIWIDELDAIVGAPLASSFVNSQSPKFEVPDAYLHNSDGFIDMQTEGNLQGIARP
jgi:peptidoglycan/xylan/chitin deacetylase (PgdA/CDA1 family)